MLKSHLLFLSISTSIACVYSGVISAKNNHRGYQEIGEVVPYSMLLNKRGTKKDNRLFRVGAGAVIERNNELRKAREIALEKNRLNRLFGDQLSAVKNGGLQKNISCRANSPAAIYADLFTLLDNASIPDVGTAVRYKAILDMCTLTPIDKHVLYGMIAARFSDEENSQISNLALRKSEQSNALKITKNIEKGLLTKALMDIVDERAAVPIFLTAVKPLVKALVQGYTNKSTERKKYPKNSCQQPAWVQEKEASYLRAAIKQRLEERDRLQRIADDEDIVRRKQAKLNYEQGKYECRKAISSIASWADTISDFAIARKDWDLGQGIK